MEETTSAFMDEEFGVDLSDMIEADADDGNQTGDTKAAGDAQDSGENVGAADAGVSEGTPSADAKEKTVETPPELFELKFNKQTQQVTREQMTELAQKGLNHDRILQQRDSLQQNLNQQLQWRSQNEAVLADVEGFAKDAGMSVADFLDGMRINMLVNNGMSREAAVERVRADRLQRQLDKDQKKQQQARLVQNQQAQARQRQERDIQAFLQKYPSVDPKTIPSSVWAEVQKGETLVSAYGSYQNQRLEAQIRELNARLAAQEQNQKNKQNSLGSVKSAGSAKNDDDFLRGFDSV